MFGVVRGRGAGKEGGTGGYFLPWRPGGATGLGAWWGCPAGGAPSGRGHPAPSSRGPRPGRNPKLAVWVLSQGPRPSREWSQIPWHMGAPRCGQTWWEGELAAPRASNSLIRCYFLKVTLQEGVDGRLPSEKIQIERALPLAQEMGAGALGLRHRRPTWRPRLGRGVSSRAVQSGLQLCGLICGEGVTYLAGWAECPRRRSSGESVRRRPPAWTQRCVTSGQWPHLSETWFPTWKPRTVRAAPRLA